MRRRSTGFALGAMLFALCSHAEAQQATKVHHVGFLEEGSISLRAHLWEALRQRLRELGYLERANGSLTLRLSWSR
jgi:hypothetical protein